MSRYILILQWRFVLLLRTGVYPYEYMDSWEKSNQQQIIEQAKFTYSPLGKAFEKQTKTIEDKGKKQVEALNTLKSKSQLLRIEDVIPKIALNNGEAKKELDKISEIENVDGEKLIYETNEYTYSLKNLQAIKTFGRNIYEGKITLEKANEYKTNLLAEIINFRKNTKQRSEEKNKKKKLFFKTCIIFLKVEKKLLMLLKAKYF